MGVLCTQVKYHYSYSSFTYSVMWERGSQVPSSSVNFCLRAEGLQPETVSGWEFGWGGTSVK